jgi:hypothetical protein
MSVAAFFEEYMRSEDREDKTIKKLKDWPAYTEFREKFPAQYDDFQQAMPVPDYTRRDGVLNISAHVSYDEDALMTLDNLSRVLGSFPLIGGFLTSVPKCTTHL